jgi:hypothetical protein
MNITCITFTLGFSTMSITCITFTIGFSKLYSLLKTLL